MKLSLVFFISSFFSASIYAETCVEKISAIEVKIEHTKKHGNPSQLKGLETALAETKSNCTDEKLLSEKNEKIKNKEADVEKARQELEKAKSANKSKKKIKKMQRKLNKQIKELEEVKTSMKE